MHSSAVQKKPMSPADLQYNTLRAHDTNKHTLPTLCQEDFTAYQPHVYERALARSIRQAELEEAYSNHAATALNLSATLPALVTLRNLDQRLAVQPAFVPTSELTMLPPDLAKPAPIVLNGLQAASACSTSTSTTVKAEKTCCVPKGCTIV